MVNSTELAWLC